MLGLSIFTSILATAAAIAIPQNGGSPGLPAETLQVTYYQGEAGIDGSNDFCGAVAVVSGNITTGVCHQEYTYSLSITALQRVGQDCNFVLWKGTTTCSDSEAASKNSTFIPAGGQEYCVTTDVLDGGAHTYASGMLFCYG